MGYSPGPRVSMLLTLASLGLWGVGVQLTSALPVTSEVGVVWALLWAGPKRSHCLVAAAPTTGTGFCPLRLLTALGQGGKAG